MTGTYTIPPNTHAVYDTGHTVDHDNIVTVLAGNTGMVFNVLNTAYSGGADPTGSASCDAAFNAAITALTAAGGGTLYIPTGQYKLTSGVSYSGTVPLRIVGDGPQATQIRMANTATSSTYISITNTGSWGDQTGSDGWVLVDGISFYNDHYVGAFSDTNIALYMNGVDWGLVVNCGFYKGTGGQRINQAIVMNACNQIVVDNCNIWSVVNGIALTGYNQVNVIRDTSIWQPSGSGVSTAASVLFQGQCLGTNMRHVVFHDGDRGILWTEDGGGNQPHIFVGLDVEFNNHTIAAAEFDYGVHLYLINSVFSGASVSLNVPGLKLGSNWQGDVILDACEFIGQPGTCIDIEAGTGITISNCVFGGSSTYKYASNTYDEIYIASGVSQVSISNCHFNVNANAGLGTTNPPRYAVNVQSGASEITMSNCKGANTGYGTAAINDPGAALMRLGCIGLGAADTRTGAGSTVTSVSPTFNNLTPSFTLPINDMVTNAVYEFIAFGHGTQATGSAQNLSVRLNIGGTSMGTYTPPVNPTVADPFFWTYTGYLIVTAMGSSGTVILNEQFTWGTSAPLAAANTSCHGNTSFTVDTTASNAVVMTAAWASSTGSPTITCDGAVMKRINHFPAA